MTNAPQIIYLCIVGAGLLIAAHRHGKPKEGTEHFGYTAVATAITLGLLYWGGFFSTL